MRGVAWCLCCVFVRRVHVKAFCRHLNSVVGLNGAGDLGAEM